MAESGERFFIETKESIYRSVKRDADFVDRSLLVEISDKIQKCAFVIKDCLKLKLY